MTPADDPADFTVLLPVCGRDDPGAFAEALASLAASSLAPAAMLIAEDGDLPETLSALVDGAVSKGIASRTRNPGPAGLARNLNHALGTVRTPWVARADADDLNRPDRFARQVTFLRAHRDIAVLGGTIVEFAPDGSRRRKLMPPEHEAIVRMARWRNPINHMTAFFRRDAAIAAGGYPPVPYKEDYALWLTLIGQGRRFANLEAELVEARLGNDFHARRGGLHNLSSEYALYRIRRGVPALRSRAAAAWLARSGALAFSGLARPVYERVLRR